MLTKTSKTISQQRVQLLCTVTTREESERQP